MLFLDEVAEFSRSVLDTLREPLEEHSITISRAGGAATYPARFVLIAAMNPCQCGFWGDAERECTCLPDQIERYRGRLSGPLLDRKACGAGAHRSADAARRARRLGSDAGWC